MDSYVDLFMQHGGSYITLAKGNRSHAVAEACAKHGGFYVGSIGAAAAVLAQENIKKVDVLEYPELGMEAIWKIEVKDFPAFIVVDDKGNDFFGRLCRASARSRRRVTLSIASRPICCWCSNRAGIARQSTRIRIANACACCAA